MSKGKGIDVNSNVLSDKKAKVNLDDLKIVKIEVPDPEYMSEIPEHMKGDNFPGFPSTTVICGPPGRGKTNLLMNLLKNKKMWCGFFDEIYAYGPTVKSDKLYKTIKLKDENVVDDVKNMIPDLEKKLENQTKQVTSNPNTAPKVLFLFEDMTAFFNTVQHKPAFHRCYTQIRHVKGSAITMVHKYHAFNRTPRVASQHIIIFECNTKDIKDVYEEHGPRCLTVQQFMLMVNFALIPTKENTHPFFYINTTVADEKMRFRKCFTEILAINPALLIAQPTLASSSRPRKKSAKDRRTRSASPGNKELINREREY